MPRPSCMFSTKFTVQQMDSLTACAAASGIDRSEIIRRALAMYLKAVGHNPGILESAKQAERLAQTVKGMKESLKALEKEKRLEAAKREAAEKAIEELNQALQKLKAKEDQAVKANVEDQATAVLKPSERPDFELAKRKALQTGTFKETLNALADHEARGVDKRFWPEQPKLALVLRRVYGSYPAAVEAINPPPPVSPTPPSTPLPGVKAE